MTALARISFNRPTVVGNELEHMAQAIAHAHMSSGGPYTSAVSSLLAEAHGAPGALLTTSCTDALEMSAMLLDVGPGDTVIVPSFTFVSTALAFARSGANVRFADIEPTTLGMCPNSVAELIDATVRAIVPVHYAGIGCDITGLREVIADRPIDIIEDNAHGLFGTLDGRTLGSLGRMSTLSFHETKNFSCGEGGALVLNDEADVDRAHVLLDKGTNRRQFMNGQVDKYTWVDTGSSFGLSDLLAGYLLGQLECRDEVLGRRSALWHAYTERLAPLAEEFGYETMRIPAGRDCAWHMFYVLLRDRATRDSLIAQLASEGINAAFHYVPLHSSPAGSQLTDRQADCPVTDDVSARLVRLPFHLDLGLGDVDRVCNAVIGHLDALRA